MADPPPTGAKESWALALTHEVRSVASTDAVTLPNAALGVGVGVGDGVGKVNSVSTPVTSALTSVSATENKVLSYVAASCDQSSLTVNRSQTSESQIKPCSME